MVLAQVDASFHLPGGKVEPYRDRHVITRAQEGVHLLLVQRCQAGQELRAGGGGFSLRDVKDALPLPIAIDQGGHPEDCFKHRLLLSAYMKLSSLPAFTRRKIFPTKGGCLCDPPCSRAAAATEILVAFLARRCLDRNSISRLSQSGKHGDDCRAHTGKGEPDQQIRNPAACILPHDVLVSGKQGNNEDQGHCHHPYSSDTGEFLRTVYGAGAHV